MADSPCSSNFQQCFSGQCSSTSLLPAATKVSSCAIIGSMGHSFSMSRELPSVSVTETSVASTSKSANLYPSVTDVEKISEMFPFMDREKISETLISSNMDVREATNIILVGSAGNTISLFSILQI